MPITLFFLAPWLAVSVAAGDSFTCAVTRSGSLMCWGTNSTAELGDGTTVEKRVPVLTLGGRATQVAAGSHACANLSGKLSCWGGDFWVGAHNKPRPFSTYGAVSEISVGSDYTCVVNSNHKLRCGGSGEDRLLVAGMDDVHPSELPGPVAGIDGPVKQAAAGTFHACALGSDRRVRCWGSNGWSHFVPSNEKAVPVARLIEKLDQVDELVVGATHTCVRRGGEVFCWGYNLNGQLGDGTVTTRGVPGRVDGLPPITHLASGAFTTCAIDEKKAVWCWGDNQFGTAGSPGDNATRPRRVSNLSDARAVSCGGNHCCALVGNGRLKCWGSNQFGQLGVGKPISESVVPLDVVQGY